MNIKHDISAASRRFSGAIAALAIAGGIGAFAPAAYAQSGMLSNPSNCTSFTGFTWSGGILSLTCAPPPPPPTCDNTTEPTGFAILKANDTGTTNSTVNVVISRQGTGCQSAYTVTYGSGGFPDGGNNVPVGFSPSNGGSVTFAAGETGPKNVAVSTGTSPGLIGVWLQSAIGPNGPTSANGGTAITVTQPISGGGGGGPNNLVMPAGCSTPPTYYAGSAANGVQYYAGVYQGGSLPPIKAGETLSASFVYQSTPDTPVTISLAQAVDVVGGKGEDIELSIDRCPATFPATQNDTLCDKRLQYPGTGMTVLYAYSQYPNLYCQLTPGQQYFINMRFVSSNYANGTSASCTNATGCAVRIQPQNLN